MIEDWFPLFAVLVGDFGVALISTASAFTLILLPIYKCSHLLLSVCWDPICASDELCSLKNKT